MATPKIPPPCLEFLNSEILEFQPGRAVVRYRPSAAMENPFGFIQGGILAAMIDNAAGPAAHFSTPDRAVATVSMTVNFLRPARSDEPLIGEAVVVRSGRTQAYVEVALTRESDGVLIAKATLANVYTDAVTPANSA